MNDLQSSVYHFLQALDTCFNCDYGYTETVLFERISDALLGKEFTGEGCNLQNLASASDQLRRELVYAINDEIRHGNKSICVEHEQSSCHSVNRKS